MFQTGGGYSDTGHSPFVGAGRQWRRKGVHSGVTVQRCCCFNLACHSKCQFDYWACLSRGPLSGTTQINTQYKPSVEKPVHSLYRFIGGVRWLNASNHTCVLLQHLQTVQSWNRCTAFSVPRVSDTLDCWIWTTQWSCSVDAFKLKDPEANVQRVPEEAPKKHVSGEVHFLLVSHCIF